MEVEKKKKTQTTQSTNDSIFLQPNSIHWINVQDRFLSAITSKNHLSLPFLLPYFHPVSLFCMCGNMNLVTVDVALILCNFQPFKGVAVVFSLA